jgi:hypothetical protein
MLIRSDIACVVFTLSRVNLHGMESDRVERGSVDRHPCHARCRVCGRYSRRAQFRILGTTHVFGGEGPRVVVLTSLKPRVVMTA